jgi:DNA primase catalytic core
MKSDPLRGVKTLKVSSFFDEFEKDEVKEKVDIVSLFSHFGVALEKKGKSHTGLCPFHDDKNPSLSVDRQKGLYNCFGCGEAGDVFDLVQRMKGVPFTEALTFLKSYSGNGKMKKAVKKEGSVSPPPEEKKKPETEVLSKAEEPQESQELPGLSLNTIAEHYQKALSKHPDALNYLKSRGFTGYELYKRFGIGFADGSLLSFVSEKQKEALKGLGILNGKGSEHFSGCITVPLFDESGKVVSFYGRAIDTKRKVKHLYSPGPHKGLVNRKAAGVYREEIILTESVLDALSLIEMGIENVIPCYGVNGFTAEHLKVLKDNRVKTVVLAFDSDEAGRKGAEKLKEKLLAEDFSVKVVEPSSSKEGKETKDWNEALTEGVSEESIHTLTNQAEVFKTEQETPEDFTAKREGPKYLFTTSSVTYRLLGVKELFVSSLRVNIRAEKGEERFLDNVDLYSARSRTVFATHLGEALGLEKVRIEKDLIRIVEHLEEERDRKLSSNDSEVKELTEEERRLGIELLTDPALFDRIVRDTEVLGYVGEAVNKQLIYLAASSRKLPDPISVIVVSQSAAGKSYLIDTVKKLIPPQDVVSMTSLSDQALNYMPEDGLLHKFLVMGEAVHSETIEHQVREMLSAHELSRLVTMKDVKTGVMTSRMVRKKVIVSAVMSTTDHNINPENASRSFVVNTDESEEQTKAIHRAQRKKYSAERYAEREKLIPLIIKTHHAAQRLLEVKVIFNPFAECLDFPSVLMRARRDHLRFIDLIACVCFLRQFQKEEKQTADSVVFIECDLEDYRIACNIMNTIILSTLTNFPKSAQQLYKAVRGAIKKKAFEEGLKPLEVQITQRELRKRTHLSHDTIKRNVRILIEYEYLKGSMGGRGARRSYSLAVDEELNLMDVSCIPTPEEMRLKLQNLSPWS